MAALLETSHESATDWSRTSPGRDTADMVIFNLTRKWRADGPIAAVEGGLPKAAFHRLQRALGVPQKVAAEAFMIPLRTLSRRQRLLVPESDRVFRFAWLFQRAIEVLGEGSNARRWMQTPKKALGGESPLRHARTEPGARQVEQLLGQVEHGVFS